MSINLVDVKSFNSPRSNATRLFIKRFKTTAQRYYAAYVQYEGKIKACTSSINSTQGSLIRTGNTTYSGPTQKK